MKRLLAILAVTGCTQVDAEPNTDPDPDPDPTSTIDVTLADLQPGWRVAVARITDGAPTEEVSISDGSPRALHGTATDVFVATVTDATGRLIETQSMGSHCSTVAAHQHLVPAEFSTIQAAIDIAQPGETVKVAAGTYSESLVMRPGVCLVGSGAQVTILDAHHEARTLVDLTNAPGSAVMGFTIANVAQATGCADPSDVFACSGDWYRAGIYLGGTEWRDATNDAPPLVANNAFHDCDIGMMMYWRGTAIVRNNVFLGNRSGLVANHFQDRALIANNLFQDNASLAIGNSAAYLDIIDNVILRSAIGIRFEYIQTGHIANNIFSGNGANQDDAFTGTFRFAIGTNGNIEADPRLDDGFHPLPDSPAHDTGMHGAVALEPDGSLPDIGVYGGPLAAWIDL